MESTFTAFRQDPKGINWRGIMYLACPWPKRCFLNGYQWLWMDTIVVFIDSPNLSDFCFLSGVTTMSNRTPRFHWQKTSIQERWNCLRVTPRVVEIVSASWNKLLRESYTKYRSLAPNSHHHFMGKRIPNRKSMGGVKIRPWSKNTNPLGSIFRSQERSDPGIGALAALFEVSKGRAQEVARTGEVLFFCWPWQNSTKFVLKAWKKKGWVISFCFQYWWWCGIFFWFKTLRFWGMLGCCREFSSFELWYWEGEGTVREFPRPWSWPQGIHSTCISLRPGLWLWGDGCHVPGSRGGGGCWGGFGRQSAGGHGDTEVEKLGRVKGQTIEILLAWKLWELNPKREFRLYIFSNDLFLCCVCLGRGFSDFQTVFSFVGSEDQLSSFQWKYGALGSGVWWSLCFLGFLQGLSVFCWKGREADLVLQNFGGIWETFHFFFGVRVKWHCEILFLCSRKHDLFTKPLEEKYAPFISISDAD